jgi:hypothetical protein
MMKGNSVLLYAVGILAFSLLARAQSDQELKAMTDQELEARMKSCLSLIRDRTAALVGKDWDRLEALSRRQLANCSQFLQERSRDSALESIATARGGKGDYKGMLDAATRCIDVSYRNADCHVRQAEALIKLGEIQRGRQTLDRAERLIDHLLLDYAGKADEKDRRLVEADINGLKALQDVVYATRSKLAAGESLAAAKRLASTVAGTGGAHANSSFASLTFKEGITLEVPRNWQYTNEKVRQHLNTGAEASGRTVGAPVFQGDNEILLAGSALTRGSMPSATLRLSVRVGPAPSQGDMQQGLSIPKSELRSALRPALEEVEQTLRRVDGVQSHRALDVSIVSNKHVACIYTEFEVVLSNTRMISQTWSCPLGDKAVKLSASYRTSEARLFKPVLQHVWSTLRVN